MAGCRVLLLAVWAIALVILFNDKRADANTFKGCKREHVPALEEPLARQEVVVLVCTSM
jgi:hypothetical protein